jgi:hypothetical protein
LPSTRRLGREAGVDRSATAALVEPPAALQEKGVEVGRDGGPLDDGVPVELGIGRARSSEKVCTEV